MNSPGVLRSIPLSGYALVGILGGLTVLAWLLVAQANMPMAGMLNPVSLVLFTLIWGVGMVAMMFPSLLPMAYMVAMSARKSLEANPTPSGSQKLMVPLRSALFVLGYVGIWTLVGVLFYLAITGMTLLGLPSNFGSFGFWAAVILILTGLYQFTVFKQHSLMKCRSPAGFILSRWRNGTGGAGLMGVDYGFFCTKCCWVLMAGLLIVGSMSLPLMGVFAVIIFAEKIGPFGVLVSRLVGVGFVAVGLFLLA
jgi:predicted metal-binding membrane protein